MNNSLWSGSQKTSCFNERKLVRLKGSDAIRMIGSSNLEPSSEKHLAQRPIANGVGARVRSRVRSMVRARVLAAFDQI